MIICEILLFIFIGFDFWDLKSTTTGVGALMLTLQLYKNTTEQ